MPEQATTLPDAYRWTIPADHPARRRYDQAVLVLRQHLVDGDRLTAGATRDLLGELDAAVDAMLEAAAEHAQGRVDRLEDVLAGVAALTARAGVEVVPS